MNETINILFMGRISLNGIACNLYGNLQTVPSLLWKDMWGYKVVNFNKRDQ